MKKISSFLRSYKLFSATVLAIIIGLALDLSQRDTASHFVLGGIALFAVLPLAWDMLRTLRTGGYGIDILAASAIIASVALGQYWAAVVIVLMLTGGEALEKYAERRAHSELDALLKNAPQTATVIRKGKTLKLTVDEIRIGDKLVIKAGEMVPVDAIIIDGRASFDESSLTGESLPQPKDIDSQLLSGSINLDGEVTAKATAIAADSQYQQIVKLVRNASVSQAPFVRLADRYSIPFTLLAYGIACTVWYLTGDAMRFLEVLVVATPCPLLLAAPIALMSGMARASRYGIIIKTGSSLEKLADTETVAFDKTGTLTRGELAVEAVTAMKGYTKEAVVGLAASLEQSSNHVVAHAVLAEAAAKKIKLTKAKHVTEIAGLGLSAQLKGQAVLVGRLSLLKERGVTIPSSFKVTSVTQTAVYIAVDGALAGVIAFTDELRPEAAHTLQHLHELGIRNTLMVTGDNKATAQLIAKQLGIDEVHAEALPADKLKVLETVTARPLAFVGDGVNDAPALTASDVGIALGARGSTAASESADVVIMVDDVSRVGAAFHIAKRTFSIAQQSIFIGIGLSLILMAAFATGRFTALQGALIQEVVDVVVIFNALRAHLITPSEMQE
jgi:heavy metal translocating P-type ATPase